jgi:hypothetical protein
MRTRSASLGRHLPAIKVCREFKQSRFPKLLRRSFSMKSTFLKAAKVVALSLALSLGVSGVVFANGAGAPPTVTAANGAGNSAGNGAGNGAGNSVSTAKTRWKRKAKRKARRRVRRTVA